MAELRPLSFRVGITGHGLINWLIPPLFLSVRAESFHRREHNMKSIMLFVVLISLSLAGAQALAQDPGDIGLFFDVEGTQPTGPIVAAVPFHLYLVAFDVPGGIAGYEGSLALPPALTLLSATFYPIGTSINVGTVDNWAVGTGDCLPAVGPTLLVDFFLLDLAPVDDIIFTIGPAIPSSFDPPSIGYVDCNFDLHTFGVAVYGGGYPDNSAVGNPTFQPPVATEQENWGGVKALFR